MHLPSCSSSAAAASSSAASNTENNRNKHHKRAISHGSFHQPPNHARSHSQTEPNNIFDCNICLDSATDPVITMCGHLYCWSCIYKWMEAQKKQSPFCPVCKADIQKINMIPIYGRGRTKKDPRLQHQNRRDRIPQRPSGQRPASRSDELVAEQNQGQQHRRTLESFLRQTREQLGSNHTFLPALLRFNSSSDVVPQLRELTSEQLQQAFLSRLLLILGSFVILCLLLF